MPKGPINQPPMSGEYLADSLGLTKGDHLWEPEIDTGKTKGQIPSIRWRGESYSRALPRL